jgi:hypothetical protein
MSNDNSAVIDVFDVWAFVDDVERYRQRRGWTMVEMADVCAIAYTTYKLMATRKRALGIRLVCILANVADLSIDKYRRQNR